MTEFEFSHVGWTALGKPLSLDIYKTWLSEGMAGEMSYLEDHLPIKESPQKLLPQAQSAIVVAQSYFPHPKPAKTPLQEARVALYAQGEDYHFWFREKLEKVAQKLKEEFPDHEFMTMTDSYPVLERDLAYRAGLGWIGKNTCLIHEKKGSLFFVGEIYTSLECNTQIDIAPDRCGSCTRCIDICPTDALLAPRKLDARKCISYLTIEAKSNPSLELRSGVSDWLFGCDLCQTVCPWNQKIWKTELNTDLIKKETNQKNLADDLRYILQSSNKKLQKDFKGTALSRSAGNKLKRNAIVIIANLRLNELTEEVRSYRDHNDLAELSEWCLNKLGSVQT